MDLDYGVSVCGDGKACGFGYWSGGVGGYGKAHGYGHLSGDVWGYGRCQY